MDDGSHAFKLGQTVGVSVLTEVVRVDVTGVTKGKGFQGGIKRHGHHRGPAAHGSKNVRDPGSIGDGHCHLKSLLSAGIQRGSCRGKGGFRSE